MKPSVVFRQVGILLVLLGLAMLGVVPVAWAVGEPAGMVHMGASAGATVACGLVLFLGFRRRAAPTVTRRDAFAIVTGAWVLTGVFGALPYLVSGAIPDPVDAFFESVSGFTTTGSSVLQAPETLPRTVLFWRALTQWLGGMGIIVLFVAVFAELGVGGRYLFQSEVPGPITDSVKPRIRDTSSALWRIYVLFTAAEVAALVVTGVEPFDAVCHAFTTLSTGGFSTRNDSLAGFPASAQVVAIAFMVLAGANFSLYHAAFLGRPRGLAHDREVRAYLTLIAAATLAVTASLLERHPDPLDALRHGAFQVVSLTTTTGFVTDDFNQYHPFSKILLVTLMFVGGCAGSTAGGIKVVRLAILVKVLHRGVVRMIRPQVVRPIRLGAQVIPESSVEETSGFFFLYVSLFIAVSLFVAAHGLDMATSLSSVAATLGNIGPGLERVGAISHYGGLPATVKVALTACMILGRLELYTVLGLLTSVFWRR